MTLLPLSLGVGVHPDAEKKGASVPDKKKIQKTLDRDENTCRFCGFVSSKYQRVIPYINDNDRSDFITSCTFCELAANMDRASSTGTGILLWLPEIEQTKLNHIARAIYVARESGGAMAEVAGRALDALMSRRAEVKKRLGSDDPILLATVMCESLNLTEYRKSKAKLEGIRMLPSDKFVVRTGQGSANQFPNMVAYWLSEEGPFARMNVENWSKMFQEVEASVKAPR